jgi:hypothetical protein
MFSLTSIWEGVCRQPDLHLQVESRLCLPLAFTLVSCFAYSSTLQMEAKPKRLVTFNPLHGVIFQKTELFMTTGV